MCACSNADAAKKTKKLRANHSLSWSQRIPHLRNRIVSCGVRTHAQLPAVDLKSTPLTTRANWHECLKHATICKLLQPKWRHPLLKMDTPAIQPRAFRMRNGCATMAPCAQWKPLVLYRTSNLPSSVGRAQGLSPTMGGLAFSGGFTFSKNKTKRCNNVKWQLWDSIQWPPASSAVARSHLAQSPKPFLSVSEFSFEAPPPNQRCCECRLIFLLAT